MGRLRDWSLWRGGLVVEVLHVWQNTVQGWLKFKHSATSHITSATCSHILSSQSPHTRHTVARDKMPTPNMYYVSLKYGNVPGRGQGKMSILEFHLLSNTQLLINSYQQLCNAPQEKFQCQCQCNYVCTSTALKMSNIYHTCWSLGGRHTFANYLSLMLQDS